MKKILNGLRYDTEKAEIIGSYSHSYPSDFNWWEADLYITPRSKRFFIVGEGGPMSRFSQSVGQNEWSGGSDLIPMSRAEALEFAEQYLQSEEFEHYFKDDIEEA